MAEGLCNMQSNIVDIGCGCGRFTHHLSTFRFKGAQFSGSYTGIDIDDEMLEWCRANFDATRFTFAQSTHPSKAYNKPGEFNHYTLPLKDCEADFVFSNSLFTHLLELELENYCQESFRVLRRGGWMAMFCFCTNYPPPTIGARHTFRFLVGNARVESMAVPEAAVAYEAEFLMAVARRTGFSSAEIKHARGDFQPMLLCQK
jgi:SAM-dependent methyltransferase